MFLVSSELESLLLAGNSVGLEGALDGGEILTLFIFTYSLIML